jgi:hypothetical protein
MEKIVRKLGVEKLKFFKEDFDKIIDKYRMIANAHGYHGELVFKREHGMMVIFVSI